MTFAKDSVFEGFKSGSFGDKRHFETPATNPSDNSALFRGPWDRSALVAEKPRTIVSPPFECLKHVGPELSVYHPSCSRLLSSALSPGMLFPVALGAADSAPLTSGLRKVGTFGVHRACPGLGCRAGKWNYRGFGRIPPFGRIRSQRPGQVKVSIDTP